MNRAVAMQKVSLNLCKVLKQGPRHDSPWRNRPIEESIREFQRMKEGYYKEGEAILRMKMDMQVRLLVFTYHCRIQAHNFGIWSRTV
jgi:glutamyl/glutaminyl-tRNA synthetase